MYICHHALIHSLSPHSFQLPKAFAIPHLGFSAGRREVPLLAAGSLGHRFPVCLGRAMWHRLRRQPLITSEMTSSSAKCPRGRRAFLQKALPMPDHSPKKRKLKPGQIPVHYHQSSSLYREVPHRMTFPEHQLLFASRASDPHKLDIFKGECVGFTGGMRVVP